ncbi:hypothetical protein DL96DRAFT_1822140 [Flagelloscypha sp. PMI_526]|nr:hypothetical protein DL96DRAFT_1822140 [Flagelloscypha sp. PMI_526]
MAPSPSLPAASSANPSWISVEIIVEIAKWCSPLTLLKLQKLSRQLHALLTTGAARDAWIISRRSFAIPNIPRELHGWQNLTEPALAQLIWGGGPCLNCKKYTHLFPTDFLLKIRLCSKKCRKFYVNRGNPSMIVICWENEDLRLGRHIDRFCFYPSLPMRESHDVVAQTTTHAFRKEAYDGVMDRCQDLMDFEDCKVDRKKILSRNELLKLWHRREKAMPHLAKFCNALSIWANERLRKLKRMRDFQQSNNTQINKLAHLHGIPLEMVQKLPRTMDSVRQSEMELIPFTHHLSGWVFTSVDILHELLICSGCSKRFTTPGQLDHHMRDGHSNNPTRSIVLNGRKRCPKCVGKTRTFDVRGLRAHLLVVHQLSYPIQPSPQ